MTSDSSLPDSAKPCNKAADSGPGFRSPAVVSSSWASRPQEEETLAFMAFRQVLARCNGYFSPDDANLSPVFEVASAFDRIA